MSLRRRFALLAAAAVTVTMLVVGAGLYVVFANQLQSQMDGRLRGRAQAPRALSLSTLRPDPNFSRAFQRGGTDAVFVLFLDPSQCALFRTSNADQLDVQVPDDVRSDVLAGRDHFLTVSSGGTEYRLLVTRPPTTTLVYPPPPYADATPAPAASSPSPSAAPAASQCGSAGSTGATSSMPITKAQLASSVLVVGTATQTIDDALRPLRYILAVAAAASLLLGAATGWLAARRALRPVTRLSEAVDHIGHGGDLTRRLPEPRTRDEVAVLTNGFNASLDRIEAAYRELEALLDRQRQFVADASHDLRTPLTTLRSDIATLHRHPDMSPADQSALVERSLAEVERMSRLAADLLTLARSDAGVLNLAPVDWDEVAADAVDDVRRICAPRSVAIDVESLGEGHADADAIRRVVRALAENVARHTPASTAVSLSLRRDGDSAAIRIADDGPGVDPAGLATIFDRFVRGDAARSGPGTGLGLAIARGIVEGHGGRITASAVAPHGLAVDLQIPLRP